MPSTAVCPIRVSLSRLFSPKKTYCTIRYQSTTVDLSEAEKFDRLSSEWWAKEGKFDLLHGFNKLRLPLIRDGLITSGISNPTHRKTDRPLLGVNIMDVGCGGGILTEAAARIGAKVKGIDVSEESIGRAKWHLNKDDEIKERVEYECTSVEDVLVSNGKAEGFYDAVVASEVIEHVNNVELFIESCSKLIKPGGSLFITTINKTWLSQILLITVAEHLLKIVPEGTHDWNKFVSAKNLQLAVESNGLDVRLIHGICYNPITSKFSWADNASANYAMHAIKN